MMQVFVAFIVTLFFFHFIVLSILSLSGKDHPLLQIVMVKKMLNLLMVFCSYGHTLKRS